MISLDGNRMTFEIHRQSLLAQEIARTQIKISTGKRIQKPSEDPTAAARIAKINLAQANSAVWSSNLNQALSQSNLADGVVKNLSDILARANELTLSAANATTSNSDRQTIAIELNSIADEIDSMTQTEDSQGNFLFNPSSALKMRFSESDTFAPVPAAADVFSTSGTTLTQIIRNAAAAVSSNNPTSISQAISDTGSAIEHTANMAAQIGMRGARLEQLRERLADRGTDLATERSSLEDTDLTEAIAKLNLQSITLEAAQAAFARINRRTLIDILA